MQHMSQIRKDNNPFSYNWGKGSGKCITCGKQSTSYTNDLFQCYTCYTDMVNSSYYPLGAREINNGKNKEVTYEIRT